MSEDTKIKILESAMQLFIKHGIKSITMDEIAESMSISKRTIYEHFKDKNTLVFECLKHSDVINEEKLRQIRKSCSNTIAEMMATTQEMQSQLKNVSMKFFNDLKGMNLPHEYFRQKETERQIKNEMKLVKGQEEGLIRSDLSAELLSTNVSYGIKLMAEKSMEEHPDIPMYKVINTFIKVYFRGIATDKGIKLIEEYEKSNPI